ncbi:MAG: pyridoxamine 5'-phosphate oxidase [Bacteroidota bacterium]
MTITIPDLDEHILDPDPIKQFQHWFVDATAAQLPQYDAMTLATATPKGQVSARVVLLKQVDERGFVFYTNYNSRKGRELAANSSAALVFLWKELNRAVRIEGKITKISAEESDAYFATRPRESQLSSLTSHQSEVVPSREYIDKQFDDLRAQYEGKPIPRPAHWGGYRVTPHAIEFWQHRFARLNDRVLYELQTGGVWTMKRLSP